MNFLSRNSSYLLKTYFGFIVWVNLTINLFGNFGNKQIEIHHLREKLNELSKIMSLKNEKLLSIPHDNNQPTVTFKTNDDNILQKKISVSKGINKSSLNNILVNIDSILKELEALHFIDTKINVQDSKIKSEVPIPSIDHLQNDFQDLTPTSYWDSQNINTIDSENDDKISLSNHNYWGIGYSYVQIDFKNYQSNSINFFGTHKFNNFILGYANSYFGKADYFSDDSVDILNWEYGFNGGFTLSNEIFFSPSTLVNEIRPFVSADIGYEYSFAKAWSNFDSGILNFGWGLNWSTVFGTEFILKNLSFAPFYKYQYTNPNSIFGLDIAYYIKNNWGLKLGYHLGKKYSKLEFAGLISY